MAHNYTPYATVRVLSVRIAVPAGAPEADVADLMVSMLSGAIADKKPLVLDWGYIESIEASPVITLGPDPQEGDAVTQPSLGCPYCGGHDLVTIGEWEAVSKDDPTNRCTLTEKQCENCDDHLAFWVDERF